MGEPNSTGSATSSNFLSRKLSRSEVVFATQIGLLYIIVIGALINLSINSGYETLWVGLLSAALGIVVKAPKVRNKNHEPTI